MSSSKKQRSKNVEGGNTERDCTVLCKSRQHGDEINAVLTKRALSSQEICAYLHWLCFNCAVVIDSDGRNALHLAASRGLLDVVKWLIQCRHASINSRDKESNYTALHRSIFYGQIHVAVHLIKLGINIDALDNEALTAVDIAIHDRRDYVDYTRDYESEVYIWGSNSNYTLGLQQTRLHPVLLSKQSLSFPVQQVCLHKFHCMMLTKSGQVFSCGHGQGGRLGLGKVNTALQPTQVDLSHSICRQVAIGIDHSLFLLNSGTVMSCGSNTFHVLGLLPPPEMVASPKQIFTLKEEIIGVQAGRYHSVAWSSNKIYTWGLHGGQLGHDFCLETKTIVKPKQVLSIRFKIDDVAASDGATVVACPNALYVLHKYKCQKITHRLRVAKIAVVGGCLNDDLDKSIKPEACSLKIVLLSQQGDIHVWHEATMQLTRCIFSINRPLDIRDVALNKLNILLVTKNGEAFQGKFLHDGHQKILASKKKSQLNKLVRSRPCEMISVTRLPNVHRAVTIHSDSKGQNFAVIQNEPKAHFKNVTSEEASTIRDDLLNLLLNSDELDTIHDVIFKCNNRKFAAHKFIVASASERLSEKITTSTNNVVEIENIDWPIFEEVLQFIYGKTCDVSSLKYASLNEINDGNKKHLIRLLNAAKQLGVTSLCKILENPIHEFSDVGFDRKSMPQLYDVQIKCKNNVEISAHKCILAGRLDYFNNLFAMRWNETNRRTSVMLPTTSAIAEVIVEFLYTDNVDKAIKDQHIHDIDKWCNILVVADELFIGRLKKICEIQIFKQLTLRNVALFYQFAAVYNCETLKYLSKKMICLNLAPILENRTLESLSDDLLEELTNFYISWNPKLNSRVITPYSLAVDDEIVQSINESFPFDIDKEEPLPVEKLKKKLRTRKNSNNEQSSPKGDENKRDYKIESNVPENFEDFEQNVNDSISSSATWKLVQTRLKINKLAKENDPSVAPIMLNCTNLNKLSLNHDSMISSPDSTDHFSPKSPSYSFNSDKEFPDVLSSGSKSRGFSSPKPNAVKVRSQRLSQKQRKKLFASEESMKQVEVASKVNRTNVWNIPESPTSPIQSFSLNTSKEEVSLSGIITEEHQKKETLHRLQTKSLHLTIIEDKAIEELKKFYNADLVFDEYLIVKRASEIELPTPIWVCNSRRKLQ